MNKYVKWADSWKKHAWWKGALTKWSSTCILLKVKVKQNFKKPKKCKHNYVYNFLIGFLNLNKYFGYQLSSPKQLFSQHFILLGQVDLLTNVQACFTRKKEWKKFCYGLTLNHPDCVVWTNTHSYQQVYKKHHLMKRCVDQMVWNLYFIAGESSTKLLKTKRCQLNYLYNLSLWN